MFKIYVFVVYLYLHNTHQYTIHEFSFKGERCFFFFILQTLLTFAFSFYTTAFILVSYNNFFDTGAFVVVDVRLLVIYKFTHRKHQYTIRFVLN